MLRALSFSRRITRLSIMAALAVFLCMVSSASAATVPPLLTTRPFAVLAHESVTNTGPTGVYGNLGVSPGTSITGFPPGIVHGTTHATDAVAAQAQLDNTAAYLNLSGQGCTTDLTGQNLGGLTLTPGVYCYTSDAFLTGNLTLDGQSDVNAVFIFKTVSALITASGSTVTLINSASFCNVFWKVGSSATLATTTYFVGNILALTSITIKTGARLDGRALAQTGSVMMDDNIVSNVGCPGAPEQPPPPRGLPPLPPAQVPEGDTLVLVVTGLAGLAGYAGLRWRARGASKA